MPFILETKKISDTIERCYCSGYEIAVIDSMPNVTEHEGNASIQMVEFHTVHVPAGVRYKEIGK